MLFEHGENMTCIDFGFTKSNVNVTRVSFVKKWYLLIFLRTIYHRATKFHILIDLGEDTTPINFGCTR